MVIKELLEIRRDNILKIAVIIPVIQLIVVGYITTTQIRGLTTMICDEDNTSSSRTLIQKFRNNEYYNVKYLTYSPTTIQSAFEKRQIYFCVRIPKNFGLYIKKRKETEIELIAESAVLSMDGSMSFLSTVALSKAAEIIESYSDKVFSKKIIEAQNFSGVIPKVKMDERVWYNQRLVSQIFFVPGILGFLLVIVPMIVTSLALVREKESGNMEQIVVTPIKPYQIVIGKIIPYLFISLADFLLVTLLSLFLFELPFRGNVLLFILLSTIMIIANLGVGILISTLSSSLRQAMIWDIFFISVNIVLSGIIYPMQNIKVAFQWTMFLVPFHYYLDIIRGILLKDLSFVELLPQISGLTLLSMVILFLSIKEFKKTID